MTRAVLILGSARSEGNTRQLCAFISERLNAPIIDLKTKTIGYFDYDFQNQEDDFPQLIADIIHSYDSLIFATPVYWYSMSGRMKTFFDRLSDLLIINKELGRQLKEKHMAVVSCGSDDDLKDGFYMPFIESASYLGMTYKGHVHGWIVDKGIPQEVEKNLLHFTRSLRS